VEVNVDTRYDVELSGTFGDVDITDFVDVVLFNLSVMCDVSFSIVCFLSELSSVYVATSVKHLDAL
jgi:hypothetical protein